MGTLTKIFGVVLLICFFTFVLFFGRLPALRRTPIGALHRLLVEHIPGALLRLDQRISNGRILGSVRETARFLMNDRHPTILILFIFLLAFAEYMWLPTVFPPQSLPIKLLMIIIVALPYIFLYLSVTADPGVITEANHSEHMRLYPYDHVNYHPAVPCRTCHFNKPARSKHCSICKRCVSRMDHHCIFINGCVGYGNMHWFMLLLLSTTVLTVAGASFGINFVTDYIREKFPSFTLRGTGYTWEQYFQLVGYALDRMPAVGGVSLLCTLCTPLVLTLLLYTLYQVWAGVTTNESGKWDDTKLDIRDGWLYKRPIEMPRRWDEKLEPYLDWPKQTSMVVLSMENRAADDDPKYRGRGIGPWVRVESMDELENMYDTGFWHGLKDIFLRRPDWSVGKRLD